MGGLLVLMWSLTAMHVMTHFAIGGFLELRQRAFLAVIKRLGRLQQRGGFFLPTGGAALGWFIQRQREVILDQFGEVLLRALAILNLLSEGIVALVQRFHYFRGRVFRFFGRSFVGDRLVLSMCQQGDEADEGRHDIDDAKFLLHGTQLKFGCLIVSSAWRSGF